MKKIILFLIIILNLSYLPALSVENIIKKPSATEFNSAVKKGDIQKVDAYLKAGFDPNKKYWTTWILYGTPIIGTAITSRQNQMLDFLLANGASPNPKTIFSPLIVAVVVNNPYAVKKLLESGANQYERYYGKTAQEFAISKNRTEIVGIFNDFNNLKLRNLITINNTPSKNNKTPANTTTTIERIDSKSAKTNTIRTINQKQYSKICAEKYYNYVYEDNKNRCIFQQLSKTEYKNLSKSEQLIYNNAKKAENYRKKAVELESKKENPEQYYLKALKYNSNLYSIYPNLANYYFMKGNYKLSEQYALKSIEKLGKDNTFYPPLLHMLSISIVNQEKDYESLIKYAKEYVSLDRTKYQIPDKNINHLYCIIAGANYNLYGIHRQTKYADDAIKYANLALKNSDINIQYRAHYIKYLVYFKQNNLKLAKEEAKHMVSIRKDYNGYYSLAITSTNSDDRINYFKKAIQFTKNPEDIYKCMCHIATLEQNKINSAIKTLSTYTKKPDWFEIVNSSKYGSNQYWYDRQEAFFDSTNDCINRYKGNNLASCFNQVINEQKELTAKLEEYVYRSQQLAYQQELVRQQQISNYYNAQNSYYQYMNYINNTMPTTYTITPIGNKLWINKY